MMGTIRKAARLIAAAGLLALTLAACGSAAAAPTTVPSGPTDAQVTAKDITFDKADLSVPAGKAFTLLVTNGDSVPHNVAIADAGGKTVYSGEMLTGVGSRVYQVPALTAGTYTFRCDVHPNMTGTLHAK